MTQNLKQFQNIQNLFGKKQLLIGICHRDYSIKDTDILIKMFDDRLVIENSGKLPGLVRINNIRKTHFSRNPNIMKILKEYSFVREHGEGVDRMFDEMEEAGLEDPQYEENGFMTVLTLKNSKNENKKQVSQQDKKEVRLTLDEIKILELFENYEYLTNGIIEQELGFNAKKTFRLFKSLLDKEKVKKEGEKKGTKYFLDNKCPIK